MSNINNALNTIGFLLASGATGGATAAPAPNALDPNDQRLLTTLKESAPLPLAGTATATGLSSKAAVESVNRLQARNMLEIVQYDDRPGRYIRLTPQGYGMLAGVQAF